MPKLDKLLTNMLQYKASDLHLSAGEPIRMRVNGDLRKIKGEALSTEQLLNLMKELCNENQWNKYISSHELDFAYGLKDVSRFRCNYLSQARGPGAVFRLIPEKITPLKDLDLPPVIQSLSKLKRGLVLVTGPTGSGKSTTLAAIIDNINQTRSKHIITIEDPIEFVHRNNKSFIAQREIGSHAPSFPRALSDAMHQDPDVLLLGELRDYETISLAITAAEMGVLVFATLHTNSASKTIDRIIDTFPALQKDQVRGMLSESLKAIVAQQLIKRIDKKGRIAAVEILLHGPGLANIIREDSSSKLMSYIESGRAVGMRNLDEVLLELVDNSIISADAAYLKSNDKFRFEGWLKEREISINY